MVLGFFDAKNHETLLYPPMRFCENMFLAVLCRLQKGEQVRKPNVYKREKRKISLIP